MKLLTYKDAAEICQMSESWIKKQVRNLNLPFVKFGRSVRISEEALIEFIEGSTMPLPKSWTPQREAEVIEKMLGKSR